MPSSLLPGPGDDGVGRPGQRSADRRALRSFVQRAMYCEVTGRRLMVLRAVAVTVELPSQLKTTIVMAGSVWDERKAALFEGMTAAMRRSVNVRDGRELFGRQRKPPRVPSRRAPAEQRRLREPRAGGPVARP